MAELVKQWEDGGVLSVTYEGDGDGSAVFASDTNEGIDRELSVTFKGGNASVEKVVRQIGMREIFGDFILADGGTFNVLKESPRILPSYLTPIEYLQGDGKSWINTGFMASYKTHVVADISDVNVSFLWGVRDTASGTSPRQFGLYRRTASSLRSYYFGTSKDGEVVDTSQRHIVEQNGNVVSAYGVEIINTDVNSGVTTYPLYLFALNSVGSASGMSSMKLYSCKIYDDGILVRDYEPCMDESGKKGLYDYVNKTFVQIGQ